MASEPVTSEDTLDVDPLDSNAVAIPLQEVAVATPIEDDDDTMTHQLQTYTEEQLGGKDTLDGNTWLITIAIDVLLYASLAWNDFANQKWTITVFHYSTWYIITNILVFFVPPNKRKFWLPARLIAGPQMIALNVNFIIRGLEDIGSPQCIVRMVMLVVYTAHSAWLYYGYGPSVQTILSLFGEMIKLHNLKTIAAGWLIIATAAFFASNALFVLHYDYGEERLGGPMTAFQGMGVFAAHLKAVILDYCIPDLKTKCRVQMVILVLFAIQWPIVPDLFFKAPVPFGHLVAEFCVLYDAVRICVLPKSWIEEAATKDIE